MQNTEPSARRGVQRPCAMRVLSRPLFLTDFYPVQVPHDLDVVITRPGGALGAKPQEGEVSVRAGQQWTWVRSSLRSALHHVYICIYSIHSYRDTLHVSWTHHSYTRDQGCTGGAPQLFPLAPSREAELLRSSEPPLSVRALLAVTSARGRSRLERGWWVPRGTQIRETAFLIWKG